ncbi:adenylate/guanylate cyclase domain-containing protein [Azospirillum sp. RWY-5-1]|uniref:Adenylate/guanylate cyclase domain-containing protein n=1 Tax=Azospirillum oleiclasticum TaxID=2735135 RepID=A0ABX2THA0_9PROT|nr:adenylate/guanylate cyclase domain-containing protein [Azospirillum oleiclasticum]NYZ17274.1 adenylate/guanylate cyclase domain-containing protein [Azospirillum oleiclasticum]NYZ23442.1 adenylate/guanylate cyclase domain-containing protein [Azospirillum oleiclasticum]
MEKHRLVALLKWINTAALGGADESALLSGFCEQLKQAGLPVWRAIIGTDTLHPVIAGHVVTWMDGTDAELTDYRTEDHNPDNWERSPFFLLYNERGTLLRRRLDDSYARGEFPKLDELQDGGCTDYVCLLHHLGADAVVGDLDCVFSSFTTREPGGFTDDQVAALGPLVATLAVAIHNRGMVRIARTLVETYLGRDAGERVLRGQIRRGVAETIRAVLWFSDLQGFTKITDTADPATVIPMLNDYADALVSAIRGNGGEVLKFIGDGILAIFPLDEGGAACTAALDAAVDARARCQVVNARRKADGAPVTRFYLGLHVGEVFYGNIGSADRLDFTVVGPAVNEASRIAAMCRSLDQDVLVSSAFAAAAPACGERLISVGRYLLRGVGRPQELFTLDPDRSAAG